MKFEGPLEAHDIARRAPRIETGFKVLVRCPVGAVPAVMTNLSATGFRLRSARKLEPGWEVSLEVPKLAAVRCIIRWADGKIAGGVFLEPVAL